MRVRPAKREGANRIIFDKELGGDAISFGPEGIAISVTAESLHKKSRYRDNSSYRYDIVLSAAEIAELARQIGA
ncbi:hypothetical protein [Mesorhizobium sp. SP-1A]|uniref:hypothetical protein n=1 Tax=Mesorhizobium sp. SP-1A TaxID=3077840 RepID=UPI0028F72522|nr:hypothetical protein [Mesorhizobium sp. SP-1A]